MISAETRELKKNRTTHSSRSHWRCPRQRSNRRPGRICRWWSWAVGGRNRCWWYKGYWGCAPLVLLVSMRSSTTPLTSSSTSYSFPRPCGYRATGYAFRSWRARTQLTRRGVSRVSAQSPARIRCRVSKERGREGERGD